MSLLVVIVIARGLEYIGEKGISTLRQGVVKALLLSLILLCTACSLSQPERNSTSLEDLDLVVQNKQHRGLPVQTVVVEDTKEDLSPDAEIIEETQELLPLSGSYATLVEQVIALGEKLLGKPYRYAKGMPWQLDCSGYVKYLFHKHGVKLSRTSRSQYQEVQKIKKKDVRRGDLIFFTGRNKKSKVVGHVGIVVSNPGEAIRFIHSRRGGIGKDYLSSPYYKARLIGFGRVVI